MKSFEQIKEEKTYRALPEYLKHCLGFLNFIDWEIQSNGNLDLLEEFLYFRYWVFIEAKKLGINKNIAPKVTDKNYIGVWMSFNVSFNRESIKKMKHERYRAINSYNGIKFLELP